MYRLFPLLLALLISGPSWAVCDGAPAWEDPPAARDVIKRADESARVSWQPPAELCDGTEIASDPAFALTGFELFVSVGAPVDGSGDPLLLPPEALEHTVELASLGVRAGDRVYFGVRAVNAGGKSTGFQRFAITVGPPGKPFAGAVE